ncbi:MAG: glycosyltransferase family 39 protein [Betaproteobacteria bacterium]|nr:glycosyltransferase family 39 protein [Betaproteobacteria bacterium]MDH3436668.1 glycosyltransferase family 39 protein [Betaproteobacteria bacterium]
MTEKRTWILFAIAAATFLPALRLHFVGEEAILPLTSLEMWDHGSWITHTIYGINAKHNPLFNWLLIPLASAAGWEYGLALSRLIMIVSVALSGLVLARLARVLFHDGEFAAFAALVYITLGDLFLQRGWLAYVDPLFGLFVFSSIAALWLGAERRSAGWLAVAVVAVTAAFMTKAITAYVFYGAAGFVLLFRSEYRGFLLSWRSLLIHLFMVIAPVLWFEGVLGGSGQGGRMLHEVLYKLAPEGLVEYLGRLVTYPLETFLRLLPASGLAAYFLWRRRLSVSEPERSHFHTALAIAALNFLPYWLSPQGAVRYLIPIFPLFGLVLARVLWRAGPAGTRAMVRWVSALIALKLVYLVVAYPYYQATYRGANYLQAASDIHARARGFTVYSDDGTAAGLSVVTHLDIMRIPQSLVTYPQDGWKDGFLLTELDPARKGKVVKSYKLGGDELFLVCRGAACDAAGR